MTAALVTLNPAAQVALASCEQRIERGLMGFLDAGQALIEIRDARLYRGTHETFEAYIHERWQMSRAHAYRMISAAEVVSPMGDIEGPAPTNERQARALAAVPEVDRADVWNAAVARTNGKPTAKAVEEVVKERATPAEPVRRPLGTPTPGPVEADAAPPTDPGTTPEHYHVGGSAGGPGENSAECACGVLFDGFDSHAEVVELMDRHIESPESAAAEPTPPADPGATSPAPEPHSSWPTEAELKPWESLAPASARLAESMEPETCLGADMDCGRPLPCPDHPRTPEERIAAVAEVAPEFVKPVETPAPAADAPAPSREPVTPPPGSPATWTAEQHEAHRLDVQRKQAIAAAERFANALVLEVRGMVTTIIDGIDFGAATELVTPEMIAECRAALDRLEARVMA